MDKLTLAHDYYMAHVKSGTLVSECEAWAYADNMFYEMDLRKDKTLPDALWQPDWSQAPDNADSWTMRSDGKCLWWKGIPVFDGDRYSDDVFGNCHTVRYAPDFNYTGDWRNSLRIRPSSK